MGSWYTFITNKYVDSLTFVVRMGEMGALVLDMEIGRVEGGTG